jgi:CRP-like cAMP-binding protein
MNHDQLREVAMITEEIEVDEGEALFEIGDMAGALYLLQDGGIDLHYVVVDELKTGKRMDFHIGHINPGDVVGISALIEPHELTATAIADSPSKLLKIDATELRTLEEQDADLAYGLQRKIARAAMERLHAVRVELLAATAEGQRPAAA